MTREEAIRWLTNEKWTNANNKYKKEWNEAFGMAIEALANLKEEFESAVPNCKRCAIKELWQETEKENLVSVVRCKDCEYKQLMDEGDTKYYYCALEDRPNRNWSVDDTDYCSWGERRK